MTDIVQVTLLVLGGFVIADLTLSKIGHGDLVAGFRALVKAAPDHFHMILNSSNAHYKELPGLAVLVGGMWIANLSYWGFNQYIIQRALAAKSLREAQTGVVFAAFLKLLMPVIIVLPGIAAVLLAPGLAKPDQAYPTMMRLLPPGLLGLVFAALVAAIVASTASKINSIATIFTLDLYNQRPRHRRGRAHNRDRRRQATHWIFRPGLPIHPGVHRLRHARHRRHLPGRPVLEARQRSGRHRGGDRFGRRLGDPVEVRARFALHAPHGVGVRAQPCVGGQRLACHPGARRRQPHRHARRRLQHGDGLQGRRARRRADPDRAIRDLVVKLG